MRHSEIIRSITIQKGFEPTHQEIADILGLTKNAISSRSHRDIEYKNSEIEKISGYYNVCLHNIDFIDDLNDKGGDLTCDYYPEVFGSCGNGTFVLSGIKYKINVPKRLISGYFPFSKYSVINASGESMLPTIQNKDLLIVEHTNDMNINDNGIYVFCYEDQVYVKRLVKNIDELIIKSDNPDPLYAPKIIRKYDMNNVLIVGRIVGLMRNMD